MFGCELQKVHPNYWLWSSFNTQLSMRKLSEMVNMLGANLLFSSGHFDIMITKWLNVEQEIKNKDMTAGSALETWKMTLPTYYIKTKDLILRWSCTKFSTGSPPTWLFCQQETKWQRKEKERKERTIIYLSTQLQIYMTRLYFSISNPDSFHAWQVFLAAL